MTTLSISPGRSSSKYRSLDNQRQSWLSGNIPKTSAGSERVEHWQYQPASGALQRQLHLFKQAGGPEASAKVTWVQTLPSQLEVLHQTTASPLWHLTLFLPSTRGATIWDQWTNRSLHRQFHWSELTTTRALFQALQLRLTLQTCAELSQRAL